MDAGFASGTISLFTDFQVWFSPSTMPFVALFVLIFLTFISLTFALLSGSVAITPTEWFEIFQGQPTLAAAIVLELRLPRALARFACVMSTLEYQINQ
jgi:ABC-type enterobactin transport system permease subunit